MTLDRVKQRIADLLRVARDDAATQGEIDNAVRAAHNLMVAHHLEEAAIIDRGDATSEPDMGRVTAASRFSRIPLWERELAWFVCNLIGGICHYYDGLGVEKLRGGRLKRFGAVVFYGIEEEVQMAADLYEEFATTIVTMARARYGGAYRGDGAVYAEGFVTGLLDQLRETGKNDLKSAGRDLVVQANALMEAKCDRAQRWLREECGIQLTRAGRRWGADGSDDAHTAGRLDGKSCDISGIGHRKAKLPSAQKLLGSG